MNYIIKQLLCSLKYDYEVVCTFWMYTFWSAILHIFYIKK